MSLLNLFEGKGGESYFFGMKIVDFEIFWVTSEFLATYHVHKIQNSVFQRSKKQFFFTEIHIETQMIWIIVR